MRNFIRRMRLFLYFVMQFCKYKLLTISIIDTFQMLHHSQELRRINWTFCLTCGGSTSQGAKGCNFEAQMSYEQAQMWRADSMYIM